MSKLQKILSVLFVFCSLFCASQTIYAQERGGGAVEEYNGNIISYNGPRVRTAFFTLRISGQTSNQDASRFLGILRDEGQDDLLRAIRDRELGTFTITGQLARDVNVVRETTMDGRRRIFVVFERWLNFGEVRGGYRSVDYPFSYVELLVDDRTGKGEGTFIPAARIDWDNDNGQQTIEIENFAIYPARLTNVTRRGRRP